MRTSAIAVDGCAGVPRGRCLYTEGVGGPGRGFRPTRLLPMAPIRRVLLLHFCTQRHVYAPHWLILTLRTGLLGRACGGSIDADLLLLKSCQFCRTAVGGAWKGVPHAGVALRSQYYLSLAAIWRCVRDVHCVCPSHRLAFCARVKLKDHRLWRTQPLSGTCQAWGTPPSNGHRRRPRRPPVGPLRPKEERMPIINDGSGNGQYSACSSWVQPLMLPDRPRNATPSQPMSKLNRRIQQT